jgi:hypothetical protein
MTGKPLLHRTRRQAFAARAIRAIIGGKSKGKKLP